MNALLTVLRKELLDAFRDRRMVLMAFLVMPLAVPTLLAGMSAVGVRKQLAKLESTLEVPVIGAEHAPNLMAWLGSQNLRFVAAPDDPDGAVRRQEHEVILRIAPDFGARWHAGEPARVEVIYDSSRPVQTGASVARLRSVLEAYSSQVGTLRLVARGVHPSTADALQLALRDVATPESRFDLTQQLLPYLLLLLAFIGGMQLAIDATAGERERQSLEPLLATPASRGALISGKILATAVFTLASLLVTLLAYRVAFAMIPVATLDLTLEVSGSALVRLLLVISPIILLGATLLTALAAFARSHREAQGYLPVLIFLPMVPTLFLMVAPVRTQLWMLAVPFLSQNQLILRVLRGEVIAWWEWGVSLGAGLTLVAVVWFVAARLYHREQLATSA
jgi:sodium transport system permease protein